MRWWAVVVVLGFANEARAEDWANAFRIEARSDADSVAVVVTPKSGYYYNTDYPAKLTLESKGVVLSKSMLRHTDGRYVDAGKPGKAKRATFRVGAKGDGTVTVRYRLTICTDINCSAPLKGVVSVRHRTRVPRSPTVVRPPPSLRAYEAACSHPRWPGAARVGP